MVELAFLDTEIDTESLKMSSIISVKVRKGWAFVFTRACTSEPTWLFSRIHLSRSVFASLPLWLVIWLEPDRLHHRWKPHYIRPAPLARCNKSHFKQLFSDQKPAGVICVPLCARRSRHMFCIFSRVFRWALRLDRFCCCPVKCKQRSFRFGGSGSFSVFLSCICVGTSYLWVMDYECVPRFRSVTGAAAFEQGSLHTLPKALLPVVMES